MIGLNRGNLKNVLCSLETDTSRYETLLRLPPYQLAARIPSMSMDDLQGVKQQTILEIGSWQAELPGVTDPAGLSAVSAALNTAQANLAQINAEIANRQGPEGPSIFEPSSGPDTASGDLSKNLGSIFGGFKKAAAIAFPVVSTPAFLFSTAKQRKSLFELTPRQSENAENLAKVGRAAAGTIAVATFAGPASPAVISAGGQVIAGQVARSGSKGGNPVAQGQAAGTAFSQIAPALMKAAPTPKAASPAGSPSFMTGPTQAPASTALSSEADGDYTDSNWMVQAGIPQAWQKQLILAADGHWIGRTMDSAYLIKKINGHVTMAKFDLAQLPEAKVVQVGALQEAPPSIGDAVGLTRPISRAQSISLGYMEGDNNSAGLLMLGGLALLYYALSRIKRR